VKIKIRYTIKAEVLSAIGIGIGIGIGIVHLNILHEAHCTFFIPFVWSFEEGIVLGEVFYCLFFAYFLAWEILILCSQALRQLRRRQREAVVVFEK
jgi:hypothetical protein